MLRAEDEPITTAALRHPEPHPAARFLHLRRLIFMARTATLATVAATREVIAERAWIEANASRMRIDELSQEIWSSPAERYQDVLERAELVAFYRLPEGSGCPWYDQAIESLVHSVFVMGGRHG